MGLLKVREEYDEEGHLIKLNLSGLGLTQIPAELGQLTNLQKLYLQYNQLTQLSRGTGTAHQLADTLSEQQPAHTVPMELVQLTNLADTHSGQQPAHYRARGTGTAHQLAGPLSVQ